MVVTKSNQPELGRYVGLNEAGGQATNIDAHTLQRIIAVKLAAQGFESGEEKKDEILDVASDLFRVYKEQSRLLEDYRCPIDQRIQDFLNYALSSTVDDIPQLPNQTLCVDRYGLARELSFPVGETEFHNSEIDSYRLSKDGVLHNPINDKRTTKGVFHVADWGLPVPEDKIPVPLVTYGRLLKAAFNNIPSQLNTLPYTAKWENPAETMVSLLLRPLVCPEVPGVSSEKRLEVRFFVPGGCCSNLDFVGTKNKSLGYFIRDFVVQFLYS